MRKFKVWIDTGDKHVEWNVNFPDDASDDRIYDECSMTLRVLLATNFDAGWEEIDGLDKQK